MTNGQGTPPVYSQGGAVVHGDVSLGGDFIGRDQFIVHNYKYQMKLIVMGGSDTEDPRTPYREEKNFGMQDSDLLTGRSAEVDAILRRIRAPHDRATVIYGPPAVGKTSLLWAGVTPRLAKSGPEMVVPVRDYDHIELVLRAPLLTLARNSKIRLNQNAEIPALMQELVTASGRPLVLVLDQFERALSPELSRATQRTWRAILTETNRVLGPTDFHILIAARSAWQAALDHTWGNLLPGVREAPVHLLPFTYAQARTAILHPTRILGVQPVFDETFLDRQLLPDLDRLSWQAEERIMPADVQTVCHFLYHKARERGDQIINASLYFELTHDKGAEWILSQRFEALKRDISQMHHELADKVAAELLARGEDQWVTPNQFAIPSEARAALQLTLEEMANAGILSWQPTDKGGRAYAFAGHSIASAAERELQRHVQARLRARREAIYSWRDWLRKGRLADIHQLRVMARHPPRDLPDERALLALRAAVVAREPVQPWLKQLTTETNQGLVRALEETTEAQEALLTPRRQAADILEIPEDTATTPMIPAGADCGPVTWTAVTHPQTAVRETAALALLAAYGEAALSRLTTAVGATDWNILRQQRRLTELFGMLMDAQPSLDPVIRKRGWGKWLGARVWHFGRQLKRNWDYVLLLTVGGSATAALGAALLRLGLSTWVSRYHAGEAFYAPLLYTALLSAALLLGLLLPDLARVNAPTPITDAAPSRPRTPQLIVGTLLFTLTYWGLVGLEGTEHTLVWLMGIPMAASFSWALARHPASTWRSYLHRLPHDLAGPVVTAALIQALFELTPEMEASLAYTWPGYFYDRLNLPALGWLRGVGDAALTALVMTGGLTLGLFWSHQRHKAWTSER